MVEQPLARADGPSTPAATMSSKYFRVTRRSHDTAHGLHACCTSPAAAVEWPLKNPVQQGSPSFAPMPSCLLTSTAIRESAAIACPCRTLRFCCRLCMCLRLHVEDIIEPCFRSYTLFALNDSTDVDTKVIRHVY